MVERGCPRAGISGAFKFGLLASISRQSRQWSLVVVERFWDFVSGPITVLHELNFGLSIWFLSPLGPALTRFFMGGINPRVWHVITPLAKEFGGPILNWVE